MISIQRILVPTDFSDAGKTALNYGVAFADQFSAAVDLVHVVEPVPAGALMSRIPSEELERGMREGAEEQMKALHGKWEDYAFPVSQLLLEGNPAVEIIRHARDSKADLIIMGTHGRGVVAHLLMGSVAERVVRQAPCPVLTVKHPEHEFIEI